jgi:hypothetical protein
VAPVDVDDNSGGAVWSRPAKQPWPQASRTQLYSHGSGPVNRELNTWTDGFLALMRHDWQGQGISGE